MTAIENNPIELTQRLASLSALLGYDSAVSFVRSPDKLHPSVHGAAVEQAFGLIGVWGALTLQVSAGSPLSRPIVYMAAADNEEHAIQIHRRVWSQGIAPVLMIVKSDAVEIRNGFMAPSLDGSCESLPWNEDLPKRLEKFHVSRIASSLFWKDFDASSQNAVDASLVTSIEQLNIHLGRRHPRLKGNADLINRMIGKIIYLCTLIDRGIVSVAWMEECIRADGATGTSFALEAVARNSTEFAPSTWSVTELYSVLDGIDQTLNGKVFAISKPERGLIPDDAWRLVHSIVRGRAQLVEGGEQLAFFDVAFDILRTETISAIYEQFLKSDDQVSQNDEGAFYTPPFLAEYALEQISRTQPLTEHSAILDPAAGSGIFLVQAFRMLMETQRPPEGWHLGNLHLGRDLLRNCIFALDRNAQAIEVCRFSLCLTLIDYVPASDIETLAHSSTEKFLPDLSQNVKVAEAIGTRPFGQRRFSHVIGNPPWTHADGMKSRSNTEKTGSRSETVAIGDAEYRARKLPVAHSRMSDRFVWAAKLAYLAPGGILGFLLPTKSLVGRHSGRFAVEFAKQFQLGFICNLSHLRYRLFATARSPACLVVARNDAFDPGSQVCVQRPQLTSLPTKGPKDWSKLWSLFVSESEEDTFRANDFISGENGWFAPLMLGTEDRVFYRAFRTWSEQQRTMEDFLERSTLEITRGADKSMTGIQDLVVGRRKNGDPKFAPKWPITKAELEGAKKHFARLFAGGVLLLPRHAKDYEYLDEPTAFRSTFNAIYDPADREMSDREQVKRGLQALKLYLETSLVSYLVPLLGAQYLIDKQRFEIGDFKKLPIPYENILDPRLLSLLEARDVSELVLEHIQASPRLKRVIGEYSSFNRFYADGQIPPTAFDLHIGSDEADYVSALSTILAGSLPSDVDIKIKVRAIDGERTLIRVGFGSVVDLVLPPETEQFVSKSVFAPKMSQHGGYIVKSDAKFAWTKAQAAEDARVILSKLVA